MTSSQGLIREVRKRAIALVFFGSTVWAQLAHGLGLGDIEVYSALNQTLEAEIALTSVRPDELDGLIVKLASEEAFTQAGVDRPFYLTRLRFSLASKPDGTPYVKVSTEDPVREPFLNFLIDIDWPRGRLVREYTILLDPPVFTSPQQSAAPQITATDDISTDTDAGVGEPALIERAPVEDEFDFVVEEGLETEGGLEADEGLETAEFGEPVDAGSLLAGIPDIEVEESPAAAGDEQSAEAEGLYDAGGESGLLTEAGGDVPVVGPDAFEFEDDSLEVQDPAEDETSEESWSAADTLALEEPLPDIDIVLDDTLPYDEVATNALLAQFAAEDSVRGTEGWSGDGERDVTQDRAEMAEGDEHEVKSGDTLHEIASRYKPADVSVNQAMLAILRYNPNAFIRGNINDVKKGFVLRIPDKTAMLEMSNAEALEEVKRQTALWRQYKSQLVGAASAPQDAQAADTFQSSRTESSSRSGELTILSPGRDAEARERAAGQQEGVEAESGALYRDLQLAREQLAAERLEKVELQERLTELNSQLETMDRLITLKNEQLAQLQQQLSELKAPGEAVSESANAQPVTPEPTAGREADEILPTPTVDVGDGAGSLSGESEDDLGLTLGGDGESPELDLLGETETAEQETGTRIAPEDTSPASEDNVSPGGIGDSQSESSVEVEEPNPASEQAESSASQAVDVETPISTPPPVKRTGVTGWIYDNVPSPYNLMLVDALESRVGTAVLGAVVIVVLLIVLTVAKSKGKNKTETKKADKKNSASIAATQTLKTRAVKPSLNERLKAMFAPLSGMFVSKKKSSLISMMSTGAAAGKNDEGKDAEKAIDDADDDEVESFDKTVMVAAAAVKNDAIKKTASEPAKAVGTDSSSKAVIAEPEEEVADDTTAEADVYLAYGLFDQAEELLTQALAANPDKLEYKGKLLETYFAAGKRTDFEKLAASIHGSLRGRPSRVWDKAVVMGKEIAPENSLFSGATNPELKISDFAPAKPETADLDLSGSQGKTTPDIEFGDEEGDSTTTDFDLDLGDDDAKLEETLISPSNSDEGGSGGELVFELGGDNAVDEISVDFNADELGLGADFGSAAQAEPDVDAGNDEASAIDMGFDLPDEAGDVDMDLSDLDISGIEDDVEIGRSASDDLIAELDSNDDSRESSVNTEFEILDDDTIIDSELDDDTFGNDSSLDEVATKLDLAKAYMDMGDYDGASSTLEEVLAEGNDSQRQEAEELLDQIN